MNRRGFLSSMIALAAAPAIVRADSLMKIVPRDVEVLTYYEQDIVIDQCRDMSWAHRYASRKSGLTDPKAIQIYAAALAADIARGSYFSKVFQQVAINSGAIQILERAP